MNRLIIRRLFLSTVIGIGIAAFLLVAESLANRGVYGWASVSEVSSILWFPGMALAGVFFSAGVHDGPEFIWSAVVITIVFYGLMSYLLASRVVRDRAFRNSLQNGREVRRRPLNGKG